MSGFFVFIGFHTFPIMMLSTKQRWRKWERERRKINRWNHSDASLCLSVVLPVMVKAPHCVLHSSSLQSLLHPISPSAPPAVPFTHFSSHNRYVPRPLLKASLKPHPPCSFISLPLNTSVKTSVRKTKGRLTLWAELLNIRIRYYNGINFLPNLFSQLLQERTRNVMLFSTEFEKMKN